MVLRVILLYCMALLLELSTANAQPPGDAQALNLSGRELLDKSQYRAAGELFRQAIEASAEQTTITYARSLAGYAEAVCSSNFDLADSLYGLSLAIMEPIQGRNPEYAQTLKNRAKGRIGAQRYDQVEEMLNAVLEMLTTHSGTQSIEYAETRGLLGWYYGDQSDFAQAEQIFTETLQLIEQIAPGSSTHGNLCQVAMLCYFRKQDYAQAERLCEQAISILKKTCLPFDRKLIDAQASLAILYGQTARFDASQKKITELLPLIEREYGKEDYAYSSLLHTLGCIYAYTGEQELAVEIFEQSMSLNKRLFGQKHDSYAAALNTLAMLYIQTERFEQAEALFKESLAIRKEMYGESSTWYINALNNLATLYQNMGSYSRALELLIRAAELAKGLNGEASMNHMMALTNIASCYVSMGSHAEAIEFAQIGEDILAQYDLAGTPEFAQIHGNNLQVFLLCAKNDPGLEQRIRRSAEMLKSIYGEQNIIYQGALSALSAYYYNIGDYPTALQYAQADTRNREQYQGHKTTQYLFALAYKGASEHKLGQWAEAEASFAKCLDVAMTLSRQNFAFMSDSERKDYWNQMKQSIGLMEEFAGTATMNRYESASLRGLIYNSNLFSKSLLLNYSSDIQKAVLGSGDAQLIALWKQLAALKLKPVEQSDEAESLNKQLALASIAYRRQQDDFSATWQAVQHNLSADEAALEIVALPVDDGCLELRYFGLLLRPGSESPGLTMLGTEAQLKAVLGSAGYSGEGLYELLVEPLVNDLEGVKRIYIAASGFADCLSFSGMKYGEGYLLDNYSICNLWSTKDIARAKRQDRQSAQSRTIALFGGADFGLPAAELAEAESVSLPPSESTARQAVRGGKRRLRGQGFDYLPGSKKEVTDIGRILSRCGWKTFVYTDNRAVEAQFKTLSSNSVEVIHLSTHGYYFPLETTETESAANRFQRSADPLIRSGLLFSGANRAWSGAMKGDSTDDGVLTAHEISVMDLGGTQLVVLSACNTALGDLDYGEGVYGLQRAFRMAGVGSVLVTLWEIPDKETAIFMKEFYGHLAQNRSARDAFDHTMRKMRQTYPENPKIWAGFVLIG